MNTPLEIASKDCRVCNRRRIRCDRRVPTCIKCEKRGLTCSGYGVILKWDQGVASRGNLKGKSVPVKRQENVLPNLAVVSLYQPPKVKAGKPFDHFDGTPFSIKASVFPAIISPSPGQGAEERRLLHHYDRIVAPNMAWAGCPENPWRHIIIPLALESPPLLNAILAFAAKHINAVYLSDDRESTKVVHMSFSENFQQQAVKLLAREIQEFAIPEGFQSSLGAGKVISRKRLNSILAAILVLCNLETVWPDSPVWQVHLNAAKTVVTSHHDTLSTRIHEDATSTFLVQELFIASTFASTTNFINFDQTNQSFKFNSVASKPSSTFFEFLKVLEMVTSLEREALSNSATLSDVSPSGLRKLFENARSRTLKIGRAYQASNTNDLLHLSRTVNCFYHAGLIYSYRVLLKDDTLDLVCLIEKQSQTRISKIELFHALGFAETSKPTFAQDLVWPLFIAGTEATRKEEQAMVVAKLQQAMSETGFSNCQHALEFLKALWELREINQALEEEFDWIPFARQWTEEGKTFLVF